MAKNKEYTLGILFFYGLIFMNFALFDMVLASALQNGVISNCTLQNPLLGLSSHEGGPGSTIRGLKNKIPHAPISFLF
jgi:hypothetical protein